MSLKYKFTALIGSIIFCWVMMEITSWCKTEPSCLVENGARFDYHYFAYAGVFAVVVCLLVFFFDDFQLDDGSFLKEVVFRKYTQADYDELYKTGYEPEEIEAERQVYNDRMKTIVLWHAGGYEEYSYIDYDGVKRDAKTDKVLR